MQNINAKDLSHDEIDQLLHDVIMGLLESFEFNKEEDD